MTLLHYFYGNTSCRIWTLQWTSRYKLPISRLYLTYGQTEEHAFLKNKNYWNTVGLQCCVSFYRTARWITVHTQRARAMSPQSCPALCDPMVGHQVPLCLGFSGHWSGLPCLPQGDLPSPGIESASLMSPALAGGYFTAGAAWEAPTYIHVCPLFWISSPFGSPPSTE